MRKVLSEGPSNIRINEVELLYIVFFSSAVLMVGIKNAKLPGDTGKNPFHYLSLRFVQNSVLMLPAFSE